MRLLETTRRKRRRRRRTAVAITNENKQAQAVCPASQVPSFLSLASERASKQLLFVVFIIFPLSLYSVSQIRSLIYLLLIVAFARRGAARAATCLVETALDMDMVGHKSREIDLFPFSPSVTLRQQSRARVCAVLGLEKKQSRRAQPQDKLASSCRWLRFEFKALEIWLLRSSIHCACTPQRSIGYAHIRVQDCNSLPPPPPVQVQSNPACKLEQL